MVQWVRLGTFTAGGVGSILGQGRSCMLPGTVRKKEKKKTKKAKEERKRSLSEFR